jgi:hypothetical protein
MVKYCRSRTTTTRSEDEGQQVYWLARGTVVLMLGDNGAEVAMFQSVGGIGWQLCGVFTVQDENAEER